MAFSINTYQDAGFEILALIDNESNARVEIIPAHGAQLHAFIIQHKGAPLNIIDSYTSLQDYQENLPDSFKNVKLSPFACRIPDARYQWEQQTYTLQKTVAPGKAIHGLLYDAAFAVVQQDANEHFAAVILEYSYKGTDPGYPFPYTCKAEYRLEPANKLVINTTIDNQGTTAIPLMDGWHPYFTTGSPVDTLELSFASSEIVEFSAQLIPTGKLLPYSTFQESTSLAGINLDNSFILDFTQSSPLCTLHDPQKEITISFYPGKMYPILQIYIPPHRHSIAIENLTGAPNAFNNGMGLLTLDQGESMAFHTAVQVKA
jgi:aldose 1-epimerase